MFKLVFFFSKNHSGQCREYLRRKQEYTVQTRIYLQFKIPYKYKGKNPQENTSKPNPTAYLKVYAQ